MKRRWLWRSALLAGLALAATGCRDVAANPPADRAAKSKKATRDAGVARPDATPPGAGGGGSGSESAGSPPRGYR